MVIYLHARKRAHSRRLRRQWRQAGRGIQLQPPTHLCNGYYSPPPPSPLLLPSPLQEVTSLFRSVGNFRLKSEDMSLILPKSLQQTSSGWSQTCLQQTSRGRSRNRHLWQTLRGWGQTCVFNKLEGGGAKHASLKLVGGGAKQVSSTNLKGVEPYTHLSNL